MTKFINAKETAKLVRSELKKHFPGTKFSVTQKQRVKWTDGPCKKEVLDVIGKFQGSSYDAQFEITNFRYETNSQGEKINYGWDYIFANRSYSKEYLQWAIDQYGLEAYNVDGDRVELKYEIVESISGFAVKPTGKYFQTCNDFSWYNQWENGFEKWLSENSKTYNKKDEEERARLAYLAEKEEIDAIFAKEEANNDYEVMLKYAGWID